VRPRLSPVEEEQPYAPHSPTPPADPFDAALEQILPLLTPASPPRIRTPSPDPLPLYTRDDTPPPPPSPPLEGPTLRPSPTLVEELPAGIQPGVLPGLDWHHNILEDGIAVRMQIPDGDDAVTIAPFVNIQPNDGSPRVRGTMGLGCPIDDQPLHAEPDRYPRLTMTDIQIQLFRGRESYTTMVNAALQDLQDVTLQADVYRYRAGLDRTRELAAQIVQARQDLHRERRRVSNTARRLADANAYARVYPRVMWDHAQSDRWPAELRREARARLWRQRNPIPIRAEGCLWCDSRNHNTEQCTAIQQCLLCCSWGHSERACLIPHTLCGPGEICRVPINHRRFNTQCHADIDTFRIDRI
jgi:hypothetical protein